MLALGELLCIASQPVGILDIWINIYQGVRAEGNRRWFAQRWRENRIRQKQDRCRWYPFFDRSRCGSPQNQSCFCCVVHDNRINKLDSCSFTCLNFWQISSVRLMGDELEPVFLAPILLTQTRILVPCTSLPLLMKLFSVITFSSGFAFLNPSGILHTSIC